MCTDRPRARGQRQLRKGRVSRAGQIYHVIAATHRRVKIFAELRCGRAVVEALRGECAAGRCRTLCFVVMPDHLHWLMQLTGRRTLAECVRYVKGRSGRSIGRLQGHSCRVWQRGYYDRALRSDEDVVFVARYIVANPVRAKLVKCLGDYPLWDAVWL